jgi:hypothetical protein
MKSLIKILLLSTSLVTLPTIAQNTITSVYDIPFGEKINVKDLNLTEVENYIHAKSENKEGNKKYTLIDFNDVVIESINYKINKYSVVYSVNVEFKEFKYNKVILQYKTLIKHFTEKYNKPIANSQINNHDKFKLDNGFINIHRHDRRLNGNKSYLTITYTLDTQHIITEVIKSKL